MGGGILVVFWMVGLWGVIMGVIMGGGTQKRLFAYFCVSIFFKNCRIVCVVVSRVHVAFPSPQRFFSFLSTRSKRDWMVMDFVLFQVLKMSKCFSVLKV